MRLVCVVAAVMALAAISPFAGCSQQAPGDAKKELEKLKKKEKPKPPFDSFKVFTEPNEKSFTDPNRKDTTRVVQAIKPGHWASVLVETKANHFDFSGELVSTPLDNQQTPLALDRSPFCLVTSRSVALPKGQTKTMEALFFAARSGHMSTQISNRLQDRQHGAASQSFGEPLSHMPAYQYSMVVLARDPLRYRYLKLLDSVRPLGEMVPINPEEAAFYRLVAPQIDQPLALPTQGLCWTSTALVVWDDVRPSVLLPEQQQALLDWLHWGGVLIISGPQTFDLLRGSFLEPYLPASASEATTLGAAELAELNAHWTLTDEQNERLELRPKAPWAAVKLTPHPQADILAGTGGLVVERRVGRGRVAATAFRLSENELWNWRSFDSFFNSCILRRPRRMFDSKLSRFELVGGGKLFDPELVSNMRFFTRDAKEPAAKSAGAQLASPVDQIVEAAPASVFGSSQAPSAPAVPDPSFGVEAERDPLEIAKTEPGVAAWNDFSWVSTSARQTLRDAAGISVPKRAFVLWMLGIYLVVIVPVNWLVFRLLGRVEWAWLAVPVLAVGWGAAVIWLAQLDIGFARAETEIGVLEAQAGFPRAHLTRYMALYTSLSTSYDVHFDDPRALAQPFSVDVRLLPGQSHSTVTLGGIVDRTLSGYTVSSNTTGMVHSEQMFDLGGSLEWRSEAGGVATLENNTRLRLLGVAIIRRRLDAHNRVVDESAWLGDVAAGAKVHVEFRPHDEKALGNARNQSLLTSSAGSDGSLSVRRLVDCAQHFDSLQPGDARLVAWREGSLEGVRIEPVAAQSRAGTVVVANLEFAKAPGALPDANLRPPRRVDELSPLDADLQPAAELQP
jgi:hypothetical protein